MKNIVKKLGIIIGLLMLNCMLFLNHTSINEVGVVYNIFTHKIYFQEKPGWYITNPFVKVTYISTIN